MNSTIRICRTHQVEEFEARFGLEIGQAGHCVQFERSEIGTTIATSKLPVAFSSTTMLIKHPFIQFRLPEPGWTTVTITQKKIKKNKKKFKQQHTAHTNSKVKIACMACQIGK